MDEVRLGSRTLQPRRQLLAGGRREPIGKRALDILSVLAEARGAIVTKDELFDAVWPGVVVEENALQVHIAALRKALGPEAERLRTIRGVGYQLEIEAEEPASASRPADLPHSRTDDPTTPVARPQPTSVGGLRAVSGWLARHRLALAVMGALAMLAAGWLAFGSDLGLRAKERVPVLVRDLAPSGTGDRTEAALATGITDELIVRLRRMPELRIAAAAEDYTPGSTFANAYVIDGTIRGSGDRVKVTARLARSSGEILWSQTFDRRVSDLFEVQEAIAASIADALGVTLDAGANSAAYGGTDRPDAFAAYLQFKAHQFDRDQSVPAGHLERALALDPQYVKALAGLSMTDGIASNLAGSTAQARAMLERMDQTTARAVEANPGLWIGHFARGSYHNERRQYAAAAASFRRAAELDNGSDPELRSFLATYQLLNGHPRKALALLDSNEAIDPVTRDDPTRVWALANLGRYREAVALFEKVRADDSVSVQQHAQHAVWAYIMLGDEAEALRLDEEFGFAIGEVLRELRANPALRRMSPGQLRQWAVRRFGEAETVRLAHAALLASHEGDAALAVNLLRLVLERPGGYGISALWSPAMASTRSTDGFERLVSDVGLVRYWRESGDWPDYCQPLSNSEISCE